MLFILRNVFFLLLFLALVGCAGQDKTAPMRNGAARNYYPDSTLEIEVVYKNDVRTSIRHFYPSGKLHTEVDSAGNYRQYFENGTLAMEFTEKDGKKIGDEKIYYSNGKPKSVLKYKDGKCYHRDDYYNNGAIESACNIARKPRWREDCQTFYKSGTPKVVTDNDGHNTYYYENGKVKQDFVYRGDTLVEDREYYETGNPKRITRYDGIRVKGCVWPCNLSEEISYYANGKIKDSCYIDKPLDWDGISRQEMARVCRNFYENGNVSDEPVYRDAKLIEKKKYYSTGVLEKHEFYGEKGYLEKKEYYPSGSLFKHVVYEDYSSGRESLNVSYYKNGVVRDSCFEVDPTGNKRINVCNRFNHDGKPLNLFIEKDGSFLEQTFYDDGKLKSVDVYGAVGKLAYTRYFEDGSVRDSCFLLRRGGEYRDVCKKYGENGSLSLLQTLKGDTIYEKKFNKEILMSECAIVWNGSKDEESVCKSYTQDGNLRDSVIKRDKKEISSYRRFFRDTNGVMVLLNESEYVETEFGVNQKFARNYYINGSLMDSCFSLYRNRNRRSICNEYEKDGTPTLLQTLKGDTIYVKKFDKGTLKSECSIVWRGYEDEVSRCKNYTEKGALRDSIVNIVKEGHSIKQWFYCDEKGKFIRYEDDESSDENHNRTIKRKNCRIEKGKLVDCKEEQIQGGENEEL